MTLFKSVRKLLGTVFSATAIAVAFLSPTYAAEHQPNANAQSVSKDLVFMVEFNLKPEARDAFLASLGQVVEDMAEEETFISTYLHQDVNDPNKFLIYERWAEPSLEAFMENQLRAKRYRDDYEARLPGWSSEPRKITILEPLGEWLR